MSQHFVGKSLSQESAPVYDLMGVVNHYGGIFGGHYTAYTRLPCAEDWRRTELGWRECDDSRVHTVTEDQVVTRAAYLLFYRRRENVDTVTSLPAHVASEKQEEEVEEGSRDTVASAQNQGLKIKVPEVTVDNIDTRSNVTLEQREQQPELNDFNDVIDPNEATPLLNATIPRDVSTASLSSCNDSGFCSDVTDRASQLTSPSSGEGESMTSTPYRPETDMDSVD